MLSTDTKDSRAKWSKRLYQMRGCGARRARKGMPSQSLLPLLQRLPDNAVVLDVGCGESGDYVIARQNGLQSYRLDLFAPSDGEHFIQGDMLNLPFGDGTIDGISSHAALSLISPFDRWGFYSEVTRVLKPNGLLSITPYPLADGFDFKAAWETCKAVDNGLHKIGSRLYSKCADSNCNDHMPEDNWEALKLSTSNIDIDPDFRRIAPLLIAWVVNSCNVHRTIEFTQCRKSDLREVIKGANDCGIYDPKKHALSLPWMDYFLKDEVQEGNISLVLEVLAIRGEITRGYNDDGEVVYGAAAQGATITCGDSTQ